MLGITKSRVASVVASRHFRKTLPWTQTAQLHRQIQSEFFVIVWDKASSKRADLVTSFADLPKNFTFAGELLDKDSFEARGNCLACKAASAEDVFKSLEQTPWSRQGIWDMVTVDISPLQTVHTSDLVQVRRV